MMLVARLHLRRLLPLPLAARSALMLRRTDPRPGVRLRRLEGEFWVCVQCLAELPRHDFSRPVTQLMKAKYLCALAGSRFIQSQVKRRLQLLRCRLVLAVFVARRPFQAPVRSARRRNLRRLRFRQRDRLLRRFGFLFSLGWCDALGWRMSRLARPALHSGAEQAAQASASSAAKMHGIEGGFPTAIIGMCLILRWPLPASSTVLTWLKSRVPNLDNMLSRRELHLRQRRRDALLPAVDIDFLPRGYCQCQPRHRLRDCRGCLVTEGAVLGGNAG